MFWDKETYETCNGLTSFIIFISNTYSFNISLPYMKLTAKVHEPFYEHNSKKYIRIVIPEKVSSIIERMHAQRLHLLIHNNIDDPLDGHVLTVKVPFRYRRVMCNVKGRPVQSLIKGDEIEVIIDFKGIWNVGNYSGFSWTLSSSSVGSDED
jgi:hypothetical protein|tara:strand:- start:43 stop:498 length:456 start_codon:yes stop_codon:yes gene_type:complete